jgi:hypothetical protein
MTNSTDFLIQGLKNAGRTVKTTGQDTYLAQCPAHDDGKPSLSIRKGRGQVLTFCFAGCTANQIVAALGMRIEDLFDDPKGIDYEYKSAGKVVRTVHRTPAKQFRQSIVEKDLVTLYVTNGVESFDGLNVWIPEGEKDAEVLASIGAVAVSAPMGASAWAKCDYSPLRTAASIQIIADRDKPGLERAYGLYELFKSWGMEVYIFHPMVGKDATDHVVAGYGMGDFVDVAPPEIVDGEFESAVEDQLRRLMVAEEAKRRVAEAKAVEVGSKLEPKKLGDLLKLDVKYDWAVEGLLERKDRLIVTGGEGSGKSFLLRQMAVTMASGLHPFDKNRAIDPLRVLVVDAENTEHQWARAAKYVTSIGEKLGRGNPRENVLVSAGTRLDFTKAADVNEVHKLIDTHKPDVLYIGPLYKLVPKEISTDDDAAPLIVALDSLRERGVVLLMEAHAGHAKGIGGERDMRPRGSSALLGWPEFGYGIQQQLNDGDIYRFGRWRGDRDKRDWPSFLRRGWEGELPWEVTTNI